MGKKNSDTTPAAPPSNPFTAAAPDVEDALAAEGATASAPVSEPTPDLVPEPPVQAAPSIDPDDAKADKDPLIARVASSPAIQRLAAADVHSKLMWFQEGLFFASPQVKAAKADALDPVRKLFPAGAWVRRTGKDEWTGHLPEGAAKTVTKVTMQGQTLIDLVVALSRCITG